ncbi:GNAT family N-acetyltransferase [Vacuolonema iberomarrocanum]|uniref:GNAT family N-acetyltransferase n=1 Tax=Vacuolonema iberomarrocanum TaxID=3454632 RepID=UPI0019FD305D|nr:GNAT family N-acetyltransferase [filamentous cyanobacterium LEGE 07170]
MYAFRKVGVESTDILVNLWAETFTQAYHDIHSLKNIRTYCDQNYSAGDATAILSSDQFDCIIAYREEVPVGYYLLNYQSCPTPLDGASSELKQIYILSSEYGAGLGRILAEHAFDVARRAGSKWIWLCVSNSNYRAQKFYKKLNFEPVASGPILVVGTDELSSTIMTLCIEE